MVRTIPNPISRKWKRRVVKETLHSCSECEYTTKRKHDLKKHLSYRHDIDVQWHQCEYCDDKFKQKGNLNAHISNKHNIGVQWHQCEHCGDKFKQKGTLKMHIAYKHDIGVTWYQCKYCDDKFKQKGHLKQHMADKHDINVKWYECELCDDKFKQKTHLISHMAYTHDVGITWHQCQHCDHKSKGKSDLNRHLAHTHDIGHKECTVCYKQCGILKQFKNVGICRECAVAYGAKKERIEIKYVNALKQQFDMPFVHDARVGGNACLSYRPDVLFLDANCKVHIQFELDEHQHGWKSGSYDCDEKRISDIYDEFGDNVPDHYVVVRLNPDSYGNEQHSRNKVFQKRLDHLLEVLHTVRKRPPPHRISIIYMYYDENNHRIAKNIPKYMVNDTVRLF